VRSGAAQVLVVGAAGQVGRAVVRRLETAHEVVGTTHRRPAPATTVVPAATDQDGWDRLVAQVAPDAVVVAAALTDVDACQRDPDRSRAVNVDLVGHVVRAAATHGAHVVHLSSDYVFDGRAGPYGEDEAPAPLNVYGVHKLEGEQLVLDAGGTVLRTSMVYGASREGAVDLMAHLLRRGTLEASDAQLTTPTWAGDLAWLVERVATSRTPGLVHAAGPQTVTRFDTARLVAEAAGLPTNRVRRAAPAGSSTRAPRPERCGLVVDRARDRFGYDPTTLLAGLTRHFAHRG
jgi:dTDP-4-dehydrorhamnose reductase